VIGDLHTVALVSRDGAVDFLCLPDFDSPTLFASLLDAERGGEFRIGPSLEGVDRRQLYLPDSNVLLTRFLSREGVAEVSDLMPVEGPDSIAHNLVRRVKTVRGAMDYHMVCAPRFDYGRAQHRVERRGEHAVVFETRACGGLRVALRSSVPLEVHEGLARADFHLGNGQSAQFVLELLSDGEETPCAAPRYPASAFKQTLNVWRSWIGRSRYRGRWREQVNRSALVLKLLQSVRHGSMVAAPTLGLPEVVGGERNWDYRYTWLRDASLSLSALLRLGYRDEAGAFLDWIERRCDEAPSGEPLQVLYGLDGRRQVPEQLLEQLSGYRGSRPVRIGNAAVAQLQLDVHGELLDLVQLSDRLGRRISLGLWEALVGQLTWLAQHWQDPDEGIWELRAGRRESLHSRVLCWVAFERAIRLARRRALPAPLGRWRRLRDRIQQDVLDRFWSDDLQAFVQSPGSETLDASALVLPLVRFISPTDPRWLSTLRAIERRLVEDSLVHRYHLQDGFPDGLEGTEGTFNLCSFWYVECLARSGDLQQARLAFEKMLGYANPLGLYAEELGPRGEHLGNFPQAFAHVGLIQAARALDRGLDRAERLG